ncbi:MAG: response regulator [Methanomicrobium sp.]|nr:response regulator [Methanomicrobium sp.]MDD4299374.1 response regulator [Methanomicrobium sp.]
MADAKVLIVEDEVIVAMGLERSLGSFGYDVVGLATKGEDAVRMAGELMPDLALIDINLEDNIDGIDVAERIGEKWDIPVVYLTSYTGDETLTRAIQTNPYGYLTKPARPREIYTTIETVLQKHRAIKAEKALESDKQRFVSVMDSVPLPLCIISSGVQNSSLKVSYANRRFIQKTGMDFSEISGLNPEILLGYDFSELSSGEFEDEYPGYSGALKTSDHGLVPGKLFVGASLLNGEKFFVAIFIESDKKSAGGSDKAPDEFPEKIKDLINSIKQPVSVIIAVSGLGGGVELEEISSNAEKIQSIISEFEQ